MEKLLFLTSAFWVRLGRFHKVDQARRLIHQPVHTTEKRTAPGPHSPQSGCAVKGTAHHITPNLHREITQMFRAHGSCEKFAETRRPRSELPLIVNAQLAPHPEGSLISRKGRICVMCNLSDFWMWLDVITLIPAAQKFTSRHLLSSRSPGVNNSCWLVRSAETQLCTVHGDISGQRRGTALKQMGYKSRWQSPLSPHQNIKLIKFIKGKCHLDWQTLVVVVTFWWHELQICLASVNAEAAGVVGRCLDTQVAPRVSIRAATNDYFLR